MSVEKYITPAPLPTPYQAEILEILVEEGAEVAQRKSKAVRFGLDEVQPGQPLTNKERLSQEVGDLLFMIEIALRAKVLDPEHVAIGVARKPKQLRRFMQNTPPDDHLVT